MSKKLKLDFEECSHFDAIGISCQLADYKLLFHINKQMKYKFKRVPNFKVVQKNLAKEFSLYQHPEPENHRNLFLLANKNSNLSLIPEFHQLDYFLVIDGESDSKFLRSLAKQLRKIDQIILTQIIDLESIKNYDDLASNFEYHIDHL